MPNNDGTGPNGEGPKTGRQMGKCANAIPIESNNEPRGLRRGNGRGMGRGFRNRTQN